MATLLDCNTTDQALARLHSPARNRYFYGKLLDQHHLELEQRYGIVQRRLLNRLSLGTGVLCGLRVSATADGKVRVSSGVAVDGFGRELIVPRPSRPVDPRQPTDACGRPAGSPVRGAATVTLYICYHECEEEPTPVAVSECEPENACENGIIRERYLLRIVEGDPPLPGIVTPEQCARIFGPLPPGTSRYQLACRTLEFDCAPPDEACVPLASIALDDAGNVASIDECAYRPVLYSNAVLLDLILCLAARVDLCCGQVAIRSLAIESGNNQSGAANTLLPAPLVASVSEAGSPVPNETVTFEVETGGGAIGEDPSALGASFQVQTDAAGLATLPHWRLGPAAGVQRVRARIAAGMPAQVTFTATARAVRTELPVILALWPPNAQQLSLRSPTADLRAWAQDWLSSPRIEITFNHKMRQQDLQKPDGWLRVFQLRSFGQNEIQVMPLRIGYIGPIPTGVLGVAGFTEAYRMDFSQAGLQDELGLRFLMLIRAEAASIMDTSTPALLLDAEFAGTKLSADHVQRIWELTGQQFFPQDVWDALVDTGAKLPQSGDGAEGGRFDGWFGVSLTG